MKNNPSIKTHPIENEILWNDPDTASWYSNRKQRCNLCGRRSDTVIEMVNNSTNEVFGRFCMFNGRDCMRSAMNMFFVKYQDEELLLCRGIRFKPSTTIQKREPIGLSKRYTVMKRDGFKCVLCGATASSTTLEIDHIVPVANGGTNKMDNLQTLCFDCNRGKRDTE